VEVVFYPKEGESLEKECIKREDVCVDQRMQEDDKRTKHVETYMHVYKCEEKNYAANCILEKGCGNLGEEH
jgi:hypothetical protein